MNNKHIVLSVVIGVVLVAMAGFAFYAIDLALTGSKTTPSLGTAAAYQAMNNQNLLTELQAINTDATAVRTSVAGTLYTAQFTLPALGADNTSTSTTSVLVTATTTAGDFVYAQFATTSVPYVTVGVQPVSGSQVRVTFFNTSSTATSALGSSSTVNVWTVPSASFVQPAALTQ